MKQKRRLLFGLQSQKQTMADRSRFTLVEVIGSCLITAIIVTAAIALINFLQWSMVLTHRTARASAIANSRIEQMHAAQFFDLKLLEESEIRVDERGVPGSDGLYLRSTVIDDQITTAEGATLSSRPVTVRVSAPWKPGSQDIEIELTTIIIDPGILRVEE